jgi:hypothetical protein
MDFLTTQFVVHEENRTITQRELTSLVKCHRSCCLRFDPSRYYGNSRTLRKKTLTTRTEEYDSGSEAGAAASSRFSSDRSSVNKLRELVIMLKNSMRDPQRSQTARMQFFPRKNSKVHTRAHRFERLVELGFLVLGFTKIRVSFLF